MISFPLRTPGFCVLMLVLLGASQNASCAPKTNARDPGRDLFSTPHVLSLGIELAPDTLETLKKNEDSHAYVTCTVREGGQSWEDVGLRCRGTPPKEFASGKPDLVITFDKFVSGQQFHGHRRFVLQASREDPSYLSAPIAFEMFLGAGARA